MEDQQPMDEAVAVAKGRGRYLTTLFLLAVSFMLFQMAVLRELRFQLSALFTLTPFLFSSVIVAIGLGSLGAGWLKGTGTTALRRTVGILPLIFVPVFVLMVGVAQKLVDRGTLLNIAAKAGTGDTTRVAHLDGVAIPFLMTALCGYGIVFFLQGFAFTLYFRRAVALESCQESTLSISWLPASAHCWREFSSTS